MLSFKVVAAITSNDHRQNFCSDAGISSRAVFGLPSLVRPPKCVEDVQDNQPPTLARLTVPRAVI